MKLRKDSNENEKSQSMLGDTSTLFGRPSSPEPGAESKSVRNYLLRFVFFDVLIHTFI